MSSPPTYTTSSEAVPDYTPSLNYYSISLIKTEFLTPYHYNGGNRSWKPVLLELNSTQLKIYNLNVDKKFNELLTCLYFELNSLNQLTKDLNSHYKKNNGIDFSEFINGNDDDVSDLFAGDAYGGMDSTKLVLSDSGFGKLRNKLKNQKANKTLQSIKLHYDELKDNKFLFEPTACPSEYQDFAKKHRGSLLHCYSLSHLQVGEAPSLNQLISAMYKEEHIGNTNNSSLVKYKNTLRLRIEYKQILLQFWSFHGMINWFRNLTIGRDLSTPVELRQVTQLKSIPSRNTSRNNALLAATAAAANYGRRRHSTSVDVDQNNQMFNSSQMLVFKEHDSDSEDALSQNSSVFEQEARRRESITSTTTSIEPANYVIINDFKFFSQDNIYNTVEKQYISNCIPDLNSFDKWNGKLMTISDLDYFVGQKRRFDGNDDIFISNGALNDLVMAYGKKHVENADLATKTFVIHQSGLVGLSEYS
ncbi:hypothetical protein SBY92_001299 [Candida maltosa Xu316]|uniref:Uncharacterized protein n=1 Tax=Candida maltosa (strain Xu316) TaxID=1245528 RepID=M3HPX0_CANMX|nr:hypothetical protein G210_5700 [Candida maltosa Xu316]